MSTTERLECVECGLPTTTDDDGACMSGKGAISELGNFIGSVHETFGIGWPADEARKLVALAIEDSIGEALNSRFPPDPKPENPTECDARPDYEPAYTPRLDRILSHSYLGRWPTQEDTALAMAEVKELRDQLRTANVDNMILRGLVTRIVDGPGANLKRDARAWLCGKFPR